MISKVMRTMSVALAAMVALMAVTGASWAAPATEIGTAGARAAGAVISTADPDFTIRAVGNRTLTIHTTGSTVWHGATGLADLQPGMLVVVGGVREGNGTFNARDIVVRRGVEVRGTVTAIGDHTLTVQTLNGESASVTWSTETHCRIGGTGDTGDATDSSACARIQVGDQIAARGERTGTTLAARWIGARTPATPNN